MSFTVYGKVQHALSPPGLAKMNDATLVLNATLPQGTMGGNIRSGRRGTCIVAEVSLSGLFVCVFVCALLMGRRWGEGAGVGSYVVA